MGYSWSGVCYQSTDAALVAFSNMVSTSDATGIVTLTNAPTISAGGVISWSINRRSWGSPSDQVTTGITQLPVCDSPGWNQWTSQSLFFVIALFFACMMGFRAGFRP